MSLADVQLSPYGRASTTPSPVSRMMASFAADFRDGVDVNLGVGYVNEETMPRRRVIEATREVLRRPEAHPRALNYGGPHGSANLIAAIGRYLAAAAGGPSEDVLRARRIIVGANGATSLLAATADLLPGGIVVTCDPMYYIYTNVLRRKGFQILPVPEDDEGIDTQRLRERLSELGDRLADVRFLYVVTVSNPTGTVLSNSRRRDLVRAAEELSAKLGRKVPLLLDRAYEDLIHDPAQPACQSSLDYDEAGVVHEIGTLSKIFAPGLRIGYMVAPPGDFARALTQWNSDVGFSAPKLNQEIAAYLLDRCAADQIHTVNQGYRDKAVRAGRWIDQCLGDELARRSGGSAGFYYYLTFHNVETGEGSRFFRYLLRVTGDETIDGPADARNPRVLYIPGAYCVHPEGELRGRAARQLRISYGFENAENIERALAMMRDAVGFARA